MCLEIISTRARSSGKAGRFPAVLAIFSKSMLPQLAGSAETVRSRIRLAPQNVGKFEASLQRQKEESAAAIHLALQELETVDLPSTCRRGKL
jgi:hypothetical protein